MVIISSNLILSSPEALELASQLREDLPILGDMDSSVAHNSTCEQPPAPGYLKLIYEFLVKFFQPANTSDGLTNLTESQRFDFELDDFDDPVRPPHPNASDGGIGGQTFETRTRVASSTQSVIDLPDSVSDPAFELLAAVPDIDNVTAKVPVNRTGPKGEEVDPFVGVIEDTSDVFTRLSTWFDHQLEAHPYLSLVLVMVSLLVCYVWLCWLSTHYLLSSYTPVPDVENPPPASGNGGDAPSAAGADPQPQPPASPEPQPPGEVDHRPGPEAAAMSLRNLTRSAPSLRILDEVGSGQPLPVPSATSSPPSTPSSHTYISIPSLPPSPRVPLRPLGCFNGHRPSSLELNTNHTGSHQVSTGVRCTAV